jgi:trans-aconitate methyltransferase
MTNQLTGKPETWSNYAQSLDYVTKLGAGILEQLDAKPGEKILDAGGGNGKMALQMMEKGAEVVVIDSSAAQIKACRDAGLDEQHAIQTPIEGMSYNGEFDAVFSSAVFHYLQDPEKDFKKLHDALKVGGRLVAEMGGAFTQDMSRPGQSNLQVMQEAIQQTAQEMGIGIGVKYIYHPTSEQLTEALQKAGFTVQRTQTFRRPTPNGDFRPAMKGYLSNLLPQIPGDKRDAFIDRAAAIAVEKYPKDEKGVTMDYIRLQVIATRDK